MFDSTEFVKTTKVKFNKTELTILSFLVVGNEFEDITNPWSGVVCHLSPVAVALYDYIKGCESLRSYKYFDRARYLFAKLWPDEYMNLLD